MAFPRFARMRRPVSAAVLCLTVAAALLTSPSPASAATPPSLATALSDAKSMYQLLNQERASLGLPAYRWSPALTRAAKQHNYWMSTRNTLSHQLSGEHSLGYRVSVQGYTWSAVGENVAVNGNWTLAGILSLQRMMFNEVAPNDGHRRNIVSRTFKDVGIDVCFDAVHNKTWVTQVFGRLM